jgi:hypothetical protein
MNCKYRNNTHPVCELGLYNGMPSIGMCKLCVSKNQNNLKYAKNKNNIFLNNYEFNSEPSIFRKIKNVTKSLLEWGSLGFDVSEPELFTQRITICKGCEFWDESGFVNTGRCKKCGCSTQAKLRMATEKCPIGKW